MKVNYKILLIILLMPLAIAAQSRNDAGLQGDAGAVSGFYDANDPVNFPSGADGWWHLLDVRHSNPANNYAMQFSGNFFDQQLFFRKTNNNASHPWSKVLLETDGMVGIGTTDTKGYKLAVNGNIRAKEIKVEVANWPDFVFSKGYKILTLEEIEKHIKQKGHLPEIPSVAEVKANGVDLGEMNAKLLQKIEELTLYMIEIKKENKKLNERVNQLEFKSTK